MPSRTNSHVLLKWLKILFILELFSSLMGTGHLASAFAQSARPFNMITLGDSIIWGQGLPESMKFRTLVAQWLQSQYGSSRQVVLWPTHAHSGAKTGWGAYPTETSGQDPDNFYAKTPSSGYSVPAPYPGEVPFGYPSISFQIGMTVNDLKQRGVDPGSVDLVLLDGCINDLSVTNILNPLLVEENILQGEVANGPNWVRTKTNELCVTHMQSLLPQVMSQFPNSIVIMTGYFQIVSAQTDLLKLSEYLTVLGLGGGAAGGILASPLTGPGPVLDFLTAVPVNAVPVAATLRAILVDRSQAFATTAFNGLTNVVNSANQGLATPRAALAWPSFSDENAYAGPNSYLFLIEDFLGDEVRGANGQAPAGDWNTQEGVAYYRGQECAHLHPSDPTCYAALMGHPNPKGEQAYAQAIISQLEGAVRPRLALPQLPQMSVTSSIMGQSVGQSLPLTAAITISDATSKRPLSGVQVWVQDGFGRTQSSSLTAADGSARLPFSPCPQSAVRSHLLPPSVPSPACPIYGTLAGHGMLNSWTPALAATASLTTGNALSVQVSDPLIKTTVAAAEVGLFDSQGHPLTSGTTATDGMASLNLSACSQGYLEQCKANVIVSKAGYLSCSFAVPSAGAQASSQYSPYVGATPLPLFTGVVSVVPNNTTAAKLNAGVTPQQLHVQLPALTAAVSTNGPANSPVTDVATVTSSGAPVAGANVTVGRTTVVTNASGQAVFSHAACYAGSQVAKVGATTAPARMPVPCGWTATASKAGYQSFSFTLP